ncbi:alpha/beta hydrolase [Chryseobacterium koreense]|uniref:alpha/beta hydrolase n=1 Tax=Chryseobacterium koreense TaxID=232216 RepID=UPI0026ED965E|nr:alpha/beta hydrolase [Chryseobacterium koreense]
MIIPANRNTQPLCETVSRAKSKRNQVNKIYIFSGLGVDKRVFDKIEFGNLNPRFVDWIEPNKNESIENYCKRISQEIKEENPILIGLSFGGIVAVEISKIIKTQNIILIASAKSNTELPLLYRIAGSLRITKLIPASILKRQNFITNWFFGVKSKEDKNLLGRILKETDSKFLKWAINEIANWKNFEKPINYIHIHGNNDKIIPIKNIEVNFTINNGGHFMTVNKAKEIEQIIKNVIT